MFIFIIITGCFSKCVLADVMLKVVTDVVTNNLFHFICDRCKAIVVDVATTYSMVGQCWCQMKNENNKEWSKLK